MSGFNATTFGFHTETFCARRAGHKYLGSWLSPARLAQCEAWVEEVKPKGKRVNYLWLLLGEYMQRFQPLPIATTTRFMIYNNRRNPVYYFGADVRINYDSTGVQWMQRNPSREWRHTTLLSTLVNRDDLLGKFYRYMIDYPNAFVAFAFQGDMKVLIRNRLNNPI